MKKSNLLKAFGLLTLLFVFAACNRYEEGSNFSLISAKARLANTWTISNITYTSGGNTTTITGTTGTMTISKDGTWNSTTTYTVFGSQQTDTDSGTWTFSDDKTQVTFVDSNGDANISTIIKLKNKELTLTNTDDNGNVTRIEYTGE
ncbi:MAG: hypothetical protein Crog4KO_29260 [Crocinitomicaceae bacterium]